MINWSKSFRSHLKESDIQIYLVLCWEYLNVHNFKGQMKKRPSFEIVTDGPFKGAYKADIKNGRVINSCIVIHKNSLSLNEKWFKDVLLHEMAHQYCFEVLKKPHRKHTKIWKKVCKDCGAKSCD